MNTSDPPGIYDDAPTDADTGYVPFKATATAGPPVSAYQMGILAAEADDPRASNPFLAETENPFLAGAWYDGYDDHGLTQRQLIAKWGLP